MEKNVVNEKVFFEALVKYRNSKFNILLNITNQNIILEKKKGFIKKEYKVIEKICIDDIKIINDKVKIEHKKNILYIHTKNKKFKIIFGGSSEARKAMGLIINIKTGSTLLERTSKKVVKFTKTTGRSVKAIAGVALVLTDKYTLIKENKKVLIDTIKKFRTLLKR